MLFILKDLKASEIHANYLKPLHGKSRVCQQQSDVLEVKKPLSLWHVPWHNGGGAPALYLILDGTPEGGAAVTNKVLLSGREGTVEFPLVGEHPSFSLSRYSAWTGLWHWRTLIASSTLNHSLFLPRTGQQQLLYGQFKRHILLINMRFPFSTSLSPNQWVFYFLNHLIWQGKTRQLQSNIHVHLPPSKE